uniref:Uncharacterized protein n=1 Tax=uncultured bacterium W5-102b TaxID=1130996 RepID=H9BWK6_9BACT|nr:hypothetical protein [uncultured bacterium W5-102b]
MTTLTTGLYARIKDLPVTIDEVTIRTISNENPDWERLTTEFTLTGAGHSGRGEDVIWWPEDHQALPPLVDNISTVLAGSRTVGEIDDLLATVQLFPGGHDPGIYIDYRRWGIASAAADLAMRQADTNLSKVLGIEPQPLRFAHSMGLGDNPKATDVTDWLQYDPDLEFKLDATDKWSEDLIATLAGTGRVCVIDLKSYYTFEAVRQDADTDLYAKIGAAFGDAYIEDAAVEDNMLAALGEAAARLSFDAPIHSIDDVKALTVTPAAINIKPSRFGTWQRLLDTVDYCREQGYELYGGGQFELAIGRTHAQQLASLLYPHGPNDIAPVVFHTAQPGPDLPSSPLTLPFDTGFGFDAAGAR